ncbi:MAG: hypothetical protein ABR936_17440, partial [Bacteroidota bacterium]
SNAPWKSVSKVHWQLPYDLDSCVIRDSTAKQWISKYCSDSSEAESHREKNLVNDILLSGRYLDAPISPMTLPMDQDTKIIITDSTYEALKLTVASWVR